jgi:hypothetical protein
MKQAKATAALGRFFKDKNGKLKVTQMPNLLLSVWIVLLLANLVLHDRHAQLLQGAVLFAWAYMELTQGESGFRKLLGFVVLVGVVANFFVGGN